MKIETRKISSLKPHPKNPRIHPDNAIEKLANSIKEFGFTNPILISEDGYILAGHSRLKAAKKAGLKEVPVIELPLSGEKALAYLVADNKLQDLTGWDFPALEDIFSELKTMNFDIDLTGFEMPEIDKLFNTGNSGNKNQQLTIPERYEILITDLDESKQVELLNRFQKEGLKCRALIS